MFSFLGCLNHLFVAVGARESYNAYFHRHRIKNNISFAVGISQLLKRALIKLFMVKSMTGYGKAQAERNNTLVSVEVKALNSKFLELNLRLPRAYSEKEIEIRNLLSQQLERGKVNIGVEVQSSDASEARIEFNKPLFLQYYRQLQELAIAAGASQNDVFRLALQQPEVSKSISSEFDEEEWLFISGLVAEAVQQCVAFRNREGEALQERLADYAQEIRQQLIAIEEQDPFRIEGIKERLHKKLEEAKQVEKIDQNRLEQELIYYIEKLDISEEKVRLLTHLNYFEQVMLAQDSNGKKLGFIAQEIGREINTIGSKVNDATIQRNVVIMKEGLEKIKEQVLNLV